MTAIVGVVRRMPSAAEPLRAVLTRYFSDKLGANAFKICGSSSTHRITRRFDIGVPWVRGALFTINSLMGNAK
jgi:hypothetical protein